MLSFKRSALALVFGASLGLVGCPEGDDYDLDVPGRDGGVERERELPSERLDEDESPPPGSVDDAPAPGDPFHRDPGQTGPPAPGDPFHRDPGQTDGLEHGRPAPPQRDQTQPGQ